MLDLVPHLINPLHSLGAQGALLDAAQRLLQLFGGAGAHDDGVTVCLLERAVVCDPAVGELGARTAFLVRDRLPLLQRREVAGLHVHLSVHATESFGAKAARAVLDLLRRFGEKAASQRTVGVECHAEFAERGEEFGFLSACDGRVVALVDRGEHVAFGFADVVCLFRLFGGVVG